MTRSAPRVVLLVPAFPKLSETFIVSKFLGLLAQGWDVHVVCTRSAAAEWQRYPELLGRHDLRWRIHVTWPDRPRWWAALLLPFALLRMFGQNPGCTLRYLRTGWQRWGPGVFRRLYLDMELVLLDPDLVHFEFGALAVGRMDLADLLDCKAIVSFRGYDLNYIGLDNPAHYREIWNRADAIHLLGQDLWQRALQRGCPHDKRHFLIPPGIDTATFCPPAQNEDERIERTDDTLRIVSVGRMDWRKGYEYALAAVQCLQAQGIPYQYRILGDGEFFEATAFARHQYGQEDHVALPGALPPHQVGEHLAWADVFLHAAVSEGFCNAVVEAQAMALPVVCTDAGGLGENVADGVTGFVVPRRNPEALAEKLALLAGDPSLRRQMGTAGRQRVLNHFQIADQIRKFDGMYRQVLGQQAGQREEEGTHGRTNA